MDFQSIKDRAIKNSGSLEALEQRLTKPKPVAALKDTPDDRWLAEMTKCIFQAGFNWKIIENKWDDFEDAFEGFDISRWVFMSDDDISDLLGNSRIVRNGAKIRSVGENAVMLRDIRDKYGSVGAWFAGWNTHNYTENILSLQKAGSRLGGKTGQIFLRRMGVDTPVYTKDVLLALKEAGHSGKPPTSKKLWQETQQILEGWKNEEGLSFNEISQILALSVG